MSTKTNRTELDILTSRLSNLIESEVNVQVNILGKNWKDKYEFIEQEVNAFYNNAIELRDDAKLNNFTVNQIEQEGYLRALTSIKNLFDMNKENNNNE